MTDTHKGDISTRNPKATITIGLTTAFEIFAGLIKDNLWREATIAIIPIMVFFLSLIGKNWIKEWQFKRGEKYYSNLIKRLKEDLTAAQTTDEITEIKKEIAIHQKTLDKLREDNIKIIID